LAAAPRAFPPAPRNAGNAFISFTNGIVYSRALTALRLTPLHSGIGFLHATMARHRHTLALDLAEPFKPLSAERLLRRAAHQRSLRQTDFEVDVAARRSPPPAASGSSGWYATSWPRPCTTDVCADG
jgi:CRISPR/Cas system-associated endonuclease Cas1